MKKQVSVFYGETSWEQGFFSPYYNDSHKRFKFKMRGFVEKELAPYCDEYF